jgi:hypothetical protein
VVVAEEVAEVEVEVVAVVEVEGVEATFSHRSLPVRSHLPTSKHVSKLENSKKISNNFLVKKLSRERVLNK